MDMYTMIDIITELKDNARETMTEYAKYVGIGYTEYYIDDNNSITVIEDDSGYTITALTCGLNTKFAYLTNMRGYSREIDTYDYDDIIKAVIELIDNESDEWLYETYSNLKKSL